MKSKSGLTMVPSAIIALIQVFILVLVGAAIFAHFYGGLQTPEQKAKASALRLSEAVGNIKLGNLRPDCKIAKIDLVDGYNLAVDSQRDEIDIYSCDKPPCSEPADYELKFQTEYNPAHFVDAPEDTVSKICVLDSFLALDIDTPYCSNDMWLNKKGQQYISMDFCICPDLIKSAGGQENPAVIAYPAAAAPLKGGEIIGDSCVKGLALIQSPLRQ